MLHIENQVSITEQNNKNRIGTFIYKRHPIIKVFSFHLNKTKDFDVF